MYRSIPTCGERDWQSVLRDGLRGEGLQVEERIAEDWGWMLYPLFQILGLFIV